MSVRTERDSSSSGRRQAWLNNASDAQIQRAAVGQSPSLADAIRMVHPKPASAERRALYAYLIGDALGADRQERTVRANLSRSSAAQSVNAHRFPQWHHKLG